MKSKTTKANANRGVGTDAPRGENKDQKEKRREKTSRCIKIREKMECDIQNLVEGKTFTPRKRNHIISLSSPRYHHRKALVVYRQRI
jgi:hypothetical protein